MTLFRSHAKRAVCASVAWLQASREGRRDPGFLSKQYQSLEYFVSCGRLVLGKTGRRGVGRLTDQGPRVGRPSILENLAIRK